MSQNQNSQTKIYRQQGGFPNFDKALLPVQSFLAGSLAFLASLGLFAGDGLMLYLKAGLVGMMAGAVSFAINHYAILRGAPLAATGYLLPGFFSVGSILFVGTGLFVSTYAGLTLPSVNELGLHRFSDKLQEYVAAQNTQMASATRAVPVIRIIGDDLSAKVGCEIENSCLSGKGNGGRGPIARAMELTASRASSIAEAITASEQKRQDLMRLAASQLAEFQTILGREDVPLVDRRRQLQALSGSIEQTMAELREALPLTMLGSYAAELKSGIAMNKGATKARIDALLHGHGRALEDVLASMEAEQIEKPSFPPPAGVSSVFGYIKHFLPIAAIVAVVELILPISLWIYAFIDEVWAKEQISPRILRRRIARPTPIIDQRHYLEDANMQLANVEPNESGSTQASNAHSLNGKSAKGRRRGPSEGVL